MAILCSDSFNASNTGSIHGRTLDNALGGSESKTWAAPGNLWGIADNKAVSGAQLAFALVDVPTATSITSIVTTASTNNRSGLVANVNLPDIGPGVCLYLAGGNDAIVLRKLNVDSFYGDDMANTAVSVSNSTTYKLRLARTGNVYLGQLLDAGTDDVLASVSYDFGETSFSGTYWGITPYTGENIEADNVIFYAPDAPPEGGGLLLQLMQHGQFNGGLL